MYNTVQTTLNQESATGACCNIHRSTPDTAAKVWVDADGNVTWGDVAPVVNPWDEYSWKKPSCRRKRRWRVDGYRHRLGMHNDALKHSQAMGIKNAQRVEEPRPT